MALPRNLEAILLKYGERLAERDAELELIANDALARGLTPDMLPPFAAKKMRDSAYLAPEPYTSHNDYHVLLFLILLGIILGVIMKTHKRLNNAPPIIAEYESQIKDLDMEMDAAIEDSDKPLVREIIKKIGDLERQKSGRKSYRRFFFRIIKYLGSIPKPKATLFIGISLLILFSLFPPYTATYLYSGDNYTRFDGYHCIFIPPSFGMEDEDIVYRVDLIRWFIQYATCIAIFLGIHIFRDRTKQSG